MDLPSGEHHLWSLEEKIATEFRRRVDLLGLDMVKWPPDQIGQLIASKSFKILDVLFVKYS